MSGARRIEAINQTYGKYLRYQGLVFFMSNIATSFVYYMMAKQSLLLSQEGVIVGSLFELFFFAITELMPLLSFVIVNRKFVEVMDQRDNIN